MTPAASPAYALDPVICTMPGCGTLTARGETTYIENRGPACRTCDPVRPWEEEMFRTLEPPF